MLSKDVYVIHIGTDIVMVGTEAECLAHKNAQDYNTDCWEIDNLDDCGYKCFSNATSNEY